MARVRLKVLSLEDNFHKFPTSGNKYYFKRGRFTEINNEEDVEWARKFPQRYEVEGVVEKAKGIVEKAKEKIAPKKELPEPEKTGAAGKTAYSKETIVTLNKNQQVEIIKGYGNYDIPKYEAGRVALILELQELHIGDEIPKEKLKEIMELR